MGALTLVVTHPECEDDHSLPTISEVNNARSCIYEATDMSSWCGA